MNQFVDLLALRRSEECGAQLRDLRKKDGVPIFLKLLLGYRNEVPQECGST